MKNITINSPNFGTRPLIGDIAANNGLRKYNINLTKGILDAFEKLSKNNIDDELVLNIGHKTGAKKYATDSLELLFFKKDFSKNTPNSLICQSSVSFSPKTLEKMTAKKITQLLLNSYEKLKKCTTLNLYNIDNYASSPKKCITKPHAIKINELCQKFGYDDWTCA